MDEEAAFIDALLAEPDDRPTMLVYADWLDERGDPRGEYLRLIATDRPDQRRVAHLRRTLDPGWLHLITHRHFRVGDRVQFNAGMWRGEEGELIHILPDRWSGAVRLLTLEHPVELEVGLAYLDRVAEVR